MTDRETRSMIFPVKGARNTKQGGFLGSDLRERDILESSRKESARAHFNHMPYANDFGKKENKNED